MNRVYIIALDGVAGMWLLNMHIGE